MEKVAKSEIELGLPFTVPDIEYKFQMICLYGELKLFSRNQIWVGWFSMWVFPLMCIK